MHGQMPDTVGRSQQQRKGQALPDDPWPMRYFQDVILILTGPPAMTLKVYSRRDAGAREMSLLSLITAFFLMTLFLWVYTLVDIYSDRGPMYFLMEGYEVAFFQVDNIFVLGYVILAVLWRRRIHRREKKRIQWHSRSPGIPHLSLVGIVIPWFRDVWHVLRWWEPLAWLAIALAVRQFAPATGTWMVLGAISLFIRGNLHYYQIRSVIWDHQDAILEGEFYGAMLENRPMNETGGIPTVEGMAELFAPVYLPDPLDTGRDTWRNGSDRPPVTATSETYDENDDDGLEAAFMVAVPDATPGPNGPDKGATTDA